MRKLFNDEAGLVVSAELVLVLTIGVLAMAVGLAAARDAVTHELNDLAEAFGAVSQNYNVVGLSKATGVATTSHGEIDGFGYNDNGDDCDCKAITITEVCGKTDSSTGSSTDG